MKNIVVNDEYRQADLKPKALLEEYVALLNSEVTAFSQEAKSLQSVSCPGCLSGKFVAHGKHFGFDYHECCDCASLYVSPRPSDIQIGRFFKESPAKVFWRNQLSEASLKQRKDKIIKPRLEWVIDSTAEHLPRASHWVDIHTSQRRYIEAMAQSSFLTKTIIYPYGDFTIPQGIDVVTTPWWDLPATFKADIVTLFEVLDHTSDTSRLLKTVHHMLNKDGLCFFTTILASGFDVKELGSHAANIYPPDRLNVLTVKGIRSILERHGFECLEISTPGILDLDIVTQALNQHPSIPVSPFIRALALDSDEQTRRAFGEFLQRNLLSSYGRILVRKV